MGAMLGSLIFLFSHIWNGISTDVGLTVAIALPVRPHALRANRSRARAGEDGHACTRGATALALPGAASEAPLRHCTRRSHAARLPAVDSGGEAV